MNIKNLKIAPALALGIAASIALPGFAGIPSEPDATVEYVAKAVADNHLEVVWQALPASYQSDVTGLIHQFGTTMDKELWNGSIDLVSKLVRCFTEKGDYFAGHPMLADAVTTGDSGDMDKIVELFSLVSADISDLDYLATVDPEAFLQKTGAEVMKFAKENADEDDVDEMEKLAQTKAEVVSSEGDRATLKIVTPDKDPEEVEFVRVEGRWIPAEMAEEWDEQIAEAKKGIAEMPEQLADTKAMLVAQMGMFTGGLDQVLASSSQEEFNVAVNSLMGAAMGAMMSMQGGAGGPTQ